MSPVTIPAALVQQIAEALSGIALAQLIRPGRPGDLRVVPVQHRHAVRLADASARPESGDRAALHRPDRPPLRAAVPLRRRADVVARSPDAQAGYEALMTMLPTFLAGANWVMHSAGWLEGGLVAGLREVHRRRRAAADDAGASSRRWRSTRTRWPSARTRRSGTAATSSARCTRWSGSGPASTGRCCPRRTTTSAGCATAGSTPPPGPRRSTRPSSRST